MHDVILFPISQCFLLKYSIDAPRCKEGNERKEITVARHETILLRCEVDALPNDYVRFSWTYNSTIGDVFPMPNSRIENKASVSVLEYTPGADADYGTLACWASNSIGRQRIPCIFNIVPASECYQLACVASNGTLHFLLSITIILLISILIE